MHAALLSLVAFTAAPPNLGLSLPPGFEVSLVAGDDLVHDAFVMTIHPKGHILVGGRGYLKILVDTNGDGKADSAKTLIERSDLFPMGLWWTDRELLFVSDKGLWSLPMDGLTPKGPPNLLAAVKAKGEHDAHAVKRGPDGWLYLMCGNMAAIDTSWATDANSPVKKPVAGCLVRISPDGKRRQVVADGFRNAYDFDWNAAGDPFTFDSDNERCVSLPWYEGCRLYHVVAGANHGWLAPQQGEFWRKPPYFFDVAEPLADLGRGSPTGVVCYKHTAFPPKYSGGFFLCDWTFGKIYFAALTPSGASYDAKVEVFAKPMGDDGFAPVSAVVHPLTGDLLIAIGGRGTRGAVYRIRYGGPKVGWVDAAKPTTTSPGQSGVGLAASTHPASPTRRSSIAKIEAGRMEDLLKSGEFQRFTHLIGIRMAANRFGKTTNAKGTVFEGYSFKQWWEEAIPNERGIVAGVERHWTTFQLNDAELRDWRIQRELKRLAAMVYLLPVKERETVWESANANHSLESWSARWIDELASEDSVPELVHTLICLARCPLPQGAAPKIAAALLSLDEKLEKSKAATDRNWPLRIGELHEALAGRLPDLNAEMVKHPSFGRPAHALFASGKSFAPLRPQAAARLLEHVKAQPDAEWTAEVAKLLAVLPPEQVRPTMVALWEHRGLRDELTNFFADHPIPNDAGRLVESLNSPRTETVEKAIAGVEKVVETKTVIGDVGNVVAELLAAADRAAAIPKTTIPRRATIIAGRLAGRSGATRDELLAWLKANYPTAFANLQRTGVDWPGFQARMAKTPWNDGVIERGKVFYQKAGCNACHSGGGLGPDLKGVASRFSREDLFRAIVDPSKDVPDRYRTTQVLTKSGAVKLGLVIYESADGLLLQTAPTEMLRIPSTDIEERRLTRTSLMPAGLLKDAVDRDLADLYAYLKSLR